MNEERIRTYDELEGDEKEVLDVFRQMKLMSDYNRFRFYNLKVENLIAKYEQLKQLREEIHGDYFLVYDELLSEELIEGELDASAWGITSEIKANFDLAIKMIESGEAEQSIIDAENNL